MKRSQDVVGGIKHWVLAAAIAAAGVPTVTVLAAEDDASGSRVEYTLSGGYLHQFRADLDRGGDVSVSRFRFGAGISFQITGSLDLGLRLGYEYDGYDFDGMTVFGPSTDNDLPWRGIHTFTAAPILTWKADERWRVFGGPVLRLSGEADADAGDALTGGGVIGVSYSFNDRLTLGGGVGVLSQIEDDPRFFPVILVNWRITDALRLSNMGGSGSVSGQATGVELVWSFNEHCELGLGVGYEFRRFRLDDDSVAPDGVGEETGIPILLRFGYRFNDTFSLDAHAGLNVGGEVTLDDRDGHELASDDLAASPVVGVSLRVRF